MTHRLTSLNKLSTPPFVLFITLNDICYHHFLLHQILSPSFWSTGLWSLLIQRKTRDPPAPQERSIFLTKQNPSVICVKSKLYIISPSLMFLYPQNSLSQSENIIPSKNHNHNFIIQIFNPIFICFSKKNSLSEKKLRSGTIIKKNRMLSNYPKAKWSGLLNFFSLHSSYFMVWWLMNYDKDLRL